MVLAVCCWYTVRGLLHSLSLVEPMVCGVLDPQRDADTMTIDRALVAGFEHGRAGGSADGLAHFIAAWGQTPWDNLPSPVRARLCAMETQIHEEAACISFDETPLAAHAQLRQSILVLCGTDSLPPAKRMAERLAALPGAVALHWLDGARHMDVVSAPQPYAVAIADYLRAMG